MSSGVLFSVVMPVYNASSTLRESIESVLLQTLPNFELLVVDDCSTDNSRELLKEFSITDYRVKVICSDVNQGVAAARNLGIASAEGRYIAFLDSDDIWLSNKLELQYEEFLKGAEVVFSSYFRFFPDGSEKLVMAPSNVTFKRLLRGNCIGNLTGVYDAHALGKIYQESLGHEDYLMWLRVLSKGASAVGLSTPLARYRVGSGSLSSNKIKAANWTWIIYREKLGIGLCKALYFFSSYVLHSLVKRM